MQLAPIISNYIIIIMQFNRCKPIKVPFFLKCDIVIFNCVCDSSFSFFLFSFALYLFVCFCLKCSLRLLAPIKSVYYSLLCVCVCLCMPIPNGCIGNRSECHAISFGHIYNCVFTFLQI